MAPNVNKQVNKFPLTPRDNDPNKPGVLRFFERELGSISHVIVALDNLSSDTLKATTHALFPLVKRKTSVSGVCLTILRPEKISRNTSRFAGLPTRNQ